MTEATAALLTELETQLDEAERLAANRAEHLRLTRIKTTAGRLRTALSSPDRAPA